MRLLKVISKKYNDKDVLEVENFVYEVGNVASLTSEEVGKLQCGDIVCKKDSTGLHAYIVSYKKDGTGICLTYTDCGYMETISYDYTGGQWVYNSKDVCEVASKSDVELENIKDKNGHKRFIEGNIVMETPITGFTLDYGKWSLSGSHLMIVASGTIANNTTTSWIGEFASCVGIPEWVLNKVKTIANSSYVDKQAFTAFDATTPTSSQSGSAVLRKSDTPRMFISLTNFTATADRIYRIVFDVLIDNESED